MSTFAPDHAAPPPALVRAPGPYPLSAATQAKPTRRIVALFAGATLLVISSCLGGTINPQKAAAANPVLPGPTSSGFEVHLRPYVVFPDASNGTSPRLNAMATQGDRLFVVEETDATIYELTGTADNPTIEVFLDADAAVLAATGRAIDHSNPAHSGLRSVAFHPDFDSNGLFYTSAMEERPSDVSGHHYLSDVGSPVAADSVVAEWRVDTETGQVITSSYREVFRVGMPVYDHPIKQIAFDPFVDSADPEYGLLYIGHGDGSVWSDDARGGQANDALGKILRINPLAAGDDPYTVPTSNPFSDDSSMLSEVYSLGHRNPHHLSFARYQGESVLLVAEPGRDNVEEINLIEAGADYGWPLREGTFVHLGSGGVVDGVAALPSNDVENGFSYPAAQIGHDGDIGETVTHDAVAGGYVVQNASPLSGRYLFADFVESGELYHTTLSALSSAVTTMDASRPERDEPSELTQATIEVATIKFDHDGDAATAPLDRGSLLDVFDDSPNYSSSRTDVRLGQGPAGEIFISSKRNNTIYLVTSSLPGGPGGDPADTAVPVVTIDIPSSFSRFSPEVATYSCSDSHLVSCRGYVGGDESSGTEVVAGQPLPAGLRGAQTLLVVGLDAAGNRGTASAAYVSVWSATGPYESASGYSGQIVRLYIATFARLPDAAGLQYWVERLERSASDPAIAQFFTTSPEFVSLYGTGTADVAFVETIYQNVMGRSSEGEGREFWLNELATGHRTRGQIMEFFAGSIEHRDITGTT